MDGGIRIGLALDDAQNLRRGHLIAKPIAAEQQRAIVLERDMDQLDEVRIVRGVFFRADITIYLVASRVAHGIGFGEIVVVFALAYRRMIMCDLLDSAAANLVEP